ncbi:hypothetical protein [Porphyromonas endodontalis]
MKRICFSCVVTLCTMLFVMSSSCSKDNSLKLPEEKIESSELVQTLESVNNDFMANKQEVRGTGWKKKFLRVLGVAAADIGGGYEIGKIGAQIGALAGPKGAAAGAVIGGTVGAVGASYTAYCGMRSATMNEDYPLVISAYSYMQENKELKSLVASEGIALQIPKEYKRPIEAGIEHNLMLSLLREKSAHLSAHTNQLSKFERTVTESSEFKEAYNKCTERAKAITFVPREASENEIGQKVMNLFLKIYSNYPQNQTDVNDIINKYISIIEPSTELSKEEKELIYSSLSVAAYSFKYWEATLP